jgi:type IV secretory pathway TrbL component
VPGQPIEALFDFQRVAALAPGATATVSLTVPPEVAAITTPSGVQSLVRNGGSSATGSSSSGYSVRVGDVASTGNYAAGRLVVTGDADYELFSIPRLMQAEAHGRDRPKMAGSKPITGY